jgi:hypothetical protein
MTFSPKTRRLVTLGDYGSRQDALIEIKNQRKCLLALGVHRSSHRMTAILTLFTAP